MDQASELRVKEVLSDADDELRRIQSLLAHYLHLIKDRAEGDAHPPFNIRLIDKPRVKPPASVIRTLEENGWTPDDVWRVDDIIGLRVVVVTSSDIPGLVQSILQDELHALSDLTELPIEDDSGYRAIHVKGRFSSAMGDIGCEIQIRTMLQDSWAIVSRLDLYRSGVPSVLRKIAAIQARHLAAADDALELIRREANQSTPATGTVDVQQEDSGIGEDTVEVVRGTASPSPGGLEPARQGAQPRGRTKPEIEDEALIIASGVSEGRKAAFLEDYSQDRRQTEAVEAQFKLHEVFRRVTGTAGGQAAGFNILLRKGPFVEGSSWIQYRTWQFALAMERHIMANFETALKRATATRDVRTVERSWPSLLQEADRLAASAQWGNRYRTLIVLSGPFDVDLMVDLHRHAKADWELPPDQNKTWVLGEYDGSPIVHMPESTESALYVVDVSLLGFFTAYGDVEFELDEIDEARARNLLQANANIIKVPDDLPDTYEERLRQLQLHVAIRLYERYEITVRDEGAVLKAAIAP